MSDAQRRYTLEYSSNNSGGKWWLTDGDWREMERAGWEVEWRKDGELMVREGRFLGALATSASIQTDDISATIREWEKLVNEDASAMGCGCCGRPHYFYWTDNTTGERNPVEVAVTSRLVLP